jgi:hypothetical protein
MSPRSCDTCGALLRFRPEQVERRVELRAARDQRRVRTWRVAVLCTTCANGEWAAHDAGAPAPQWSGAGAAGVSLAERRALTRRLTVEEAEELVALLFPGAVPIDPSLDAFGRPWPPPWAKLVQTGDGPRLVRRRAPTREEERAWCAGRWPPARSSAPAVCGACGVTVAAATAVEVRTEYRAVAGLSRLRTWRTGWLCPPCVDAEAEARDHPQGRPEVVRQEALL